MALLGHLAQRSLGIVAVDGDRPDQHHGPAEERHPQQFALEHLGQGLEVGREKEGFPGALVLGEDHAGPRRNVLRTLYLVAQADQRPAQPDGTATPVLHHEAIAHTERHERRADQAHQAPGECAEGQQEVEQRDAQGVQEAHRDFSSR